MTTKNETPKDNFNATIGNTMLYDALLAKLKEMEVAAAEMEKAAWNAGAENTAMTSNGAKIAYRAVIGLLEKGII